MKLDDYILGEEHTSTESCWTQIREINKRDWQARKQREGTVTGYMIHGGRR